jgi:hypothetical protein
MNKEPQQYHTEIVNTVAGNTREQELTLFGRTLLARGTKAGAHCELMHCGREHPKANQEQELTQIGSTLIAHCTRNQSRSTL